MLRFLGKTIGRRLLSGFGLMLLLIILCGAIGIISVNVIRTVIRTTLDTQFQIDALVSDAYIQFFEAQDNEKEYRLNYELIGLEEANATYIPDTLSHMTATRDNLLQIIELLRQIGADTASAQSVLDELETYQTNVLAVISLFERRGLVEEGEVGKMRVAARDLEALFTSIDNSPMLVLLLQMRRHEKDYLARWSPQYITAFETTGSELKTMIQTAGLSQSDLESSIGLLNGYMEYFAAVSGLTDQIINDSRSYETQAAQIEDRLNSISLDSRAAVEVAENVMLTQIDYVFTLISATVIAAVLIGLALVYFITRSITSPLGKVILTTEKVAAGDLSQRTEIMSEDEIGILARAFNRMAELLQVMIENERQSKALLEQTVAEYNAFVKIVAEGELSQRLNLQEGDNDDLYELGGNLNIMVDSLALMARQIKENANVISAAAAEILAAVTQQNASATEQDAAVSQTLVTVEELRATISQAAERAQQVAKVSQQSVEVSRSGQEAVGASMDGMKAIQHQVENIAENILLLSEQTQQIGSIIATVNELADQSKLLALNASIEAARAGEEGKGFAVVAMEVRQMAEQSRQATVQVRDILSRIQQATNSSVMVTEQGSKGTEQGLHLIENAGLSIQELAGVIVQAAQASTQIAASTHQQINGVDQLVIAMKSIKQATVQTATSTRQAERSAMDLNQMARQMQALTARYKLG